MDKHEREVLDEYFYLLREAEETPERLARMDQVCTELQAIEQAEKAAQESGVESDLAFNVDLALLNG